MKQLTLPITPPPEDDFGALLPGRNAQALQHLQTLGPGAALAPPVYLWGDAGTGKTRLLRALAALHRGAGARVAWFDAGDAAPWPVDDALDGGCRLVVVDRCEALGAAQQQAAFALFVDAGTQGVQWVAAGRLPPVDLPLRDDLRSRLGWGHVFALQPLAEAEARAVLRHEAGRRGLALGDEVMAYLMTHLDRNLSHLMALLDRLDRFALAEQRALTVPLLKKMLHEESPTA